MAEKAQQASTRRAQQLATLYRPCGACCRCISGTGRERDPNSTDCWVTYLEAESRPTQRSA
ncbi:hypothetical protein EDD38_7411 [Kitasatospora cineracea]|uniref:Uncharacterized protein n=1 Tax=Kitasatospora cineracea TaxID=88074 RepID=A0A3N4R3V1_9ACTN|nr:hypothetical protein EDD38_7411 [Kitasatospora cineracea]